MVELNHGSSICNIIELLHICVQYLAWSLKRSKAVNNCRKVVGVIGNGHMNGVIYSLMSDQGNLRFRDLVGFRSAQNHTGWVNTIFNNLLRDTIIGIILWLLFEQFNIVFGSI